LVPVALLQDLTQKQQEVALQMMATSKFTHLTHRELLQFLTLELVLEQLTI
jgi:hypothetical protein